MIIYASSPNRFYPYFCDQIHKLQPAVSVAQHSLLCILTENGQQYGVPTPFDCSDVGTGTRNIDAWHYSTVNDEFKLRYQLYNNAVRYDSEFRSKYNVVCGILGTENIIKEADDFIFTVMIDPVDRVYEMYHFLQYMKQGIALSQLTESDLQLFGSMFHTNGRFFTLEEYIDFYIEKKGDFNITDNLKFSPWCFLQTEQVNGNLDYVCFLTDMVSALKGSTFLNQKLNINLSISNLSYYINRVKVLCSSQQYRRAELTVLLEKEIDTFHTLKKTYI